MDKILSSHGYFEKGYGYCKISENYTHWATLMKDDYVQIFGYLTDDGEMEKCYDTGVLYMSAAEFDFLIRFFTKNYV